MLWLVDPSSSVPLFEQVAVSVRRALLDGAIQQGDKLPPAKDVAASLEINLHTVLRAYQQLRDEGLLDLRRGRGAVIVCTVEDARLRTLIREVSSEARRHGLNVAEVSRLIEREYGHA